MKKIIAFIALTLVIGVASVQAKKLPGVASKVPSEFKQELLSQIDYPSFAQSNLIEGEVWLKLALNSKYEVRVVDLSSTNQALCNYVKNELSNIYVVNAKYSKYNVYYLKLKFDLVNVD